MADLFVVIRGSSVRQLNLVLEAGGNVNVQNERLETPLMFTLINVKEMEKRSAVINALIKFGADVNIQNARGQTAFMYACILNQVKSLSILLGQKNIKVNLQDSEGNTGLMYACALGNTKTVQKLLEEHVSRRHTFKFSVENHEGLTALQYAEDGYFVDIVSMLSEIISLPSYTRPVKSMATQNKGGSDQNPTPRSKHIKTASNTTNNVSNKQKEPETKTTLKVPERDSSVSSDLKQRELDEINDLVRSVRQCAADIKQICTDHDIDYKGEKKKRNGDNTVQFQVDANGTGGWNEKPRKKSKVVVSESVMSLGDVGRNDNRTEMNNQDNMRSSTYPRRYKPRSKQFGVPNITFGESSDAMPSGSSFTKRNNYKPSFVSKSRFRLEDTSDKSAPFFKPVSKEKIQARISNRLEVPTEHKRPVSQNTPANKPSVDPTPRAMSTSLEMEKGMLSRSIGPTIDEVQPLLNKIWSSYRAPLPSISNANSPSNEQQELRLPPLRESLQNSPRGEKQTPIRIQNIDKDFLSPKARLRINKNN